VREDELTWNAFPDLPGTHVYVPWAAAFRIDNPLIRTDGGELCVDGRTYEMRRKGKRTTSIRLVPRELVDALTREQVLRIEGINFRRRAHGVVETRSHRYTFPVQGKRRRFALMTAVDESGRQVAHFRRTKVPGRWGTYRFEVVIAPDQQVTPELACMIKVASYFVWMYFESGGS
jgi:hypothetical protein